MTFPTKYPSFCAWMRHTFQGDHRHAAYYIETLLRAAAPDCFIPELMQEASNNGPVDREAFERAAEIVLGGRCEN